MEREIETKIIISQGDIKVDYNNDLWLIMGWNRDSREHKSLTNVLRTIYGTHGELYKKVGFEDKEHECHPTDNDFNGNDCFGFEKFLKKVDHDLLKETITKDLQKFINDRVKVLKVKIPEYSIVEAPESLITIEEFNEYAIENSITRMELETYNKPIYPEPKEWILMTGDKTYTVEFKEIVENNPLDAYKSQLYEQFQIQTKNIRKKYKELINKEKDRMNKKLLQLLRLTSKYKIEDGKICIGDIYADKALYDGILYELDREYPIYDIRIEINDYIYNYHISCSHHEHPNAAIAKNDDERYEVCIGQLEGAPLADVLEQIENTLKIVNLNSAYESDITDHLIQQIKDHELKKAEKILWNTEENKDNEEDQESVWRSE